MKRIQYNVIIYTDTEVPTSIELVDQLKKVDRAVAVVVTCKNISNTLKPSTADAKFEKDKEKTKGWWRA